MKGYGERSQSVVFIFLVVSVSKTARFELISSQQIQEESVRQLERHSSNNRQVDTEIKYSKAIMSEFIKMTF